MNPKCEPRRRQGHKMESVTETNLVAVIQRIRIHSSPRTKTHRTLPKIHSQGMHMKTKRNPRLTVHLNSQGNIFGMNVALTLPYWCRGKPNLFLIPKPNGLCMGSTMLVRTCRFYSPLPPPRARDEACRPCVWAGSHWKGEAFRCFSRGWGGGNVNLSEMSL